MHKQCSLKASAKLRNMLLCGRFDVRCRCARHSVGRCKAAWYCSRACQISAWWEESHRMCDDSRLLASLTRRSLCQSATGAADEEIGATPCTHHYDVTWRAVRSRTSSFIVAHSTDSESADHPSSDSDDDDDGDEDDNDGTADMAAPPSTAA